MGQSVCMDYPIVGKPKLKFLQNVQIMSKKYDGL